MPAVFPNRLFPEYLFTRTDLPITEEDACRFYIFLNYQFRKDLNSKNSNKQKLLPKSYCKTWLFKNQACFFAEPEHKSCVCCTMAWPELGPL